MARRSTSEGRPSPALAAEELLSIEMLRALRGKRTKPGFSRMLGYRSNIAQRWESAHCWPSAATFLRIAKRCGVDVASALEFFLRRRPEWMEETDPTTDRGVALLLDELRGTTPIILVAQQSGFNRYSISRWLKGSASPQLPQFLRMIACLSRRLPDFAASFFDPNVLPSLLDDWTKLERSRSLAHEMPMSHAVLRALELEEYLREGKLEFLTTRLSMTLPEVRSCLDALAGAGAVKKIRGRYRVQGTGVVDTGATPETARALKGVWTRVALERLLNRRPGNYGYALFSVSRETMKEIASIHAAYVRQMSSAIAASGPGECVGLYCSQFLDMAKDDENVFKRRSS